MPPSSPTSAENWECAARSSPSGKKTPLSPDGKRIVTGSEDKTAKIWDATTGAEMLTLKVHANVDSVAFSPDGKRIATGNQDGTAIIWFSEVDAGPVEVRGH